ncbi:MAG: hypothetical protein JNG89_03600 [Planctomycetaceae bacterium]|nr:hypothetical protein [Planctomycetaceae bacterium]
MDELDEELDNEDDEELDDVHGGTEYVPRETKLSGDRRYSTFAEKSTATKPGWGRECVSPGGECIISFIPLMYENTLTASQPAAGIGLTRNTILPFTHLGTSM